jgi:hypothetical protein
MCANDAKHCQGIIKFKKHRDVTNNLKYFSSTTSKNLIFFEVKTSLGAPYTFYCRAVN